MFCASDHSRDHLGLFNLQGIAVNITRALLPAILLVLPPQLSGKASCSIETQVIIHSVVHVPMLLFVCAYNAVFPALCNPLFLIVTCSYEHQHLLHPNDMLCSFLVWGLAMAPYQCCLLLCFHGTSLTHLPSLPPPPLPP